MLINKSLIVSIFSTKPVTEKRLKTDICIIQEILARKEVYLVE